MNDYWDSYKGTLEKTFHDYELGVESELKLDGVPAVRKEYKGALTETAYRFAQVFCIRNGTIYQITFTANDADYDRYISALDTIVTNFHFK
ncbi:MAG: PsbP-related protein [Acutalibacteraceae bacterium]